MLCRNKIRPWCLVQGQLLFKGSFCSRAAFEEVMSTKQQNTWAFQYPDRSPCSLCYILQTLQTHCQSYESLSLDIVCPHFNNLWTTIYSTHQCWYSDGDLLLLLTFCQNVWLVYESAVHLPSHQPYVFQYLWGIAAVNIWILFSLNHVHVLYMPPVLVYCSLPIARKLRLQFDVLIWPQISSQEC